MYYILMSRGGDMIVETLTMSERETKLAYLRQCGVQVDNATTDWIDLLYDAVAPRYGVRVIQVRIVPVEDIKK